MGDKIKLKLNVPAVNMQRLRLIHKAVFLLRGFELLRWNKTPYFWLLYEQNQTLFSLFEHFIDKYRKKINNKINQGKTKNFQN